jgi:hypothetical protein
MLVEYLDIVVTFSEIILMSPQKTNSAVGL